MEEKEAETGESKAARIENEIIEIGPAAEVETGIAGKIEKESMTTIVRETMGEAETVIRTGAGIVTEKGVEVAENCISLVGRWHFY